MKTRLSLLLCALAPSALLACSPAASPDAPPIAAVARNQCGRCHVAPEPRSRARAEVESAVSRHARRVRLTADEWTAMVEYLSRTDLGEGPRKTNEVSAPAFR
jgi:hypothetical protein